MKTMVDNKGVETEPVFQKTMVKVIKALVGLKHGEVTIKVQGGKVISIERYERRRVG